MQTKTIRNNIKNKIEDWLSTITDESLVKRLRKDVIVTGGCITSLFLNEKVNDYDVYISNQNTLYLLTHYYVKDKYQILDGKDKSIYVKDLEHDYNKTIEDIVGIYATSIRNLKENQIKLYLDKQAGVKFEITEDDKYAVSFLSPNAISLTNGIQIVLRFNGEPEEIHKNYDYVHATNYWTFEKGLVTNIPALESLLSKQLKYQGSLYPVTSIIRMRKFIKRGWNITAGEILKMIFQCSQLDLSNPNVLEEQLIGVDIAYFGVVIDMLRNTKYDKLDSQYLFALIDKAFDNDENEQFDSN